LYVRIALKTKKNWTVVRRHLEEISGDFTRRCRPFFTAMCRGLEPLDPGRSKGDAPTLPHRRPLAARVAL
jgi:hypothetical protein